MKKHSYVITFLIALLAESGGIANSWGFDASAPQGLDAKAESSAYKKSLDELTQSSLVRLVELTKLVQTQNSENSILGIELIIASPVKGSLVSGFGHAMLRFVNKSEDWSQDYVLSFAAKVDSPDINFFKGLTGGYEVLPVIRKLSEFWNQYVGSEDRELSRYIIPTSQKTRNQIIERIAFWVAHSEQYLSKYTFFGKNCAGLLTMLLEEAGVGAKDTIRTIIPTRVPETLAENWINVYPALTIPGLLPVYTQAALALGIEIAQLKSGQAWPVDASERLLAKMNDREIYILLQELIRMPGATRAQLISYIKSHPLSEEQILGVAKVPDSMYQLCKTRSCGAEILREGRLLWDEQSLASSEARRFELISSLKFNSEMWEYYEHLLKLTVAREIEKDPALAEVQ